MPLTFDFPLEKCKSYKGTNPRPADFDAFWDRAIEEMNAVLPEVEMVRAEFRARGAECFHLYFTGVGGARIHAKFLRPEKSAGPHPAVLMFHGYSYDSGDWSDKLAYVSQFMVLEPGDVITTGTPPGVALGMPEPQWLRVGDVMRLGIDGLGEQRQKVIVQT